VVVVVVVVVIRVLWLLTPCNVVHKDCYLSTSLTTRHSTTSQKSWSIALETSNFTQDRYTSDTIKVLYIYIALVNTAVGSDRGLNIAHW
jgi:hypothetical protein